MYYAPDVAQRTSESPPRGWRAQILRALIYSLVGFVIAWFYRVQLLSWTVEPLLDSFKSSPCSKIERIPSYSTRSMFSSYLYIGGAGAMLVGTPFIGRFVVAWLAPGALAKARFGVSFSLTSFLAMAVVVASAQLFLLPALVEHTFPSTVWCLDGWTVEQADVVNEYVASAFLAMAAATFVLELCVVAFELRRQSR
jgi:Sec-independent protein secretion pathway component TatC